MSSIHIESLLKNVEKPGRYIGGEFNEIRKDHQQAVATFAFAFPDLYEIGMSYMGMQILYNIINHEESLLCERVFAPAVDMEQLMREKQVPLFSLESKTPVREFDVLGFTLQYEMSFTNMLNMLDLGNIPLHADARTEEDPLIIAGGPCSYDPEPLAAFVDAFLIGDGEENLPAFLKLYGACKAQGKSKADFLKEAVCLEGVYVPSFYEPVYNEDNTLKEVRKLYDKAPDRVRKALVQELDLAEYPVKPLVPMIEIVQDRAVVELFRGCTRGCRFCQAGMIYRPVRERSPEKIFGIADQITQNTGQDEMTLLSLSTSDYSHFEEMATDLIDLCTERHVGLSLPSLRLDSFSFKVLNEIQKYRKSGLTFAPEAGTQRLRNVINKNITEENIFSSVRQAIELGWKHIKFYFMMGLPGETFEDLDGIADIARRVMQLNREMHVDKGNRFNVTVSVSNFVPKAHTPFQWAPQDEDFTEKHDYLSDRMKIKGVSFHYHDDPVSRLEGVFARGDRRTGYFLEEAWKNGCKFDSWSEQYNAEGWKKAEEAFREKYGYGTSFYRTRERSYDEVLPWDIVDCGVSKAFLMREMEKAKQAITTDDCRIRCNGCGVNTWAECPLEGIHG
ncbi:MAG: TIGR03960 family B12-binding radical SAM protein [Firmicutes bacterium]|nr:TIGR03960 family B12-binding radical SAM protein [Bacillota bacterium]